MDLTNKEVFLEYYRKVRQATIAAIKEFDEEIIEQKILPDQFSLGDLARHVALVELHHYHPSLLSEKPTYSGCGPEWAPGQQEILKRYTQAEEKLNKMLSASPKDFLNQTCTTQFGRIARWKVARIILEHEMHHRGQMYYLLGSFNRKPSITIGLSSEEFSPF